MALARRRVDEVLTLQLYGHLAAFVLGERIEEEGGRARPHFEEGSQLKRPVHRHPNFLNI